MILAKKKKHGQNGRDPGPLPDSQALVICTGISRLAGSVPQIQNVSVVTLA